MNHSRTDANESLVDVDVLFSMWKKSTLIFSVIDSTMQANVKAKNRNWASRFMITDNNAQVHARIVVVEPFHRVGST